MSRIKLKYVQTFTDRHGRPRAYFRRPGFKRVALPGLPGSREFMEAYQAALDGDTAPKLAIGQERTKAGTMNALIVAYYQSSDFADLAPITKKTYRNMIERWRTENGHLSITGLQTKHVRTMLDKMADRPGAAYNLRRILKVLMRFAVEREYRPDNPMIAIRRPKKATDGYRSWTEEDIETFVAKWPLGTRQHLALSLLLYTAQRRSDVVTMGRQHVSRSKIHVVQHKTKTRLAIPIHPKLAEALAYAPKDQLTFLATEAGKPRTPAGFTTWFVDAAKTAGLPPRSSPHGLRKAAARRLAEAGCSANEIMAVTGHKSLQEVATYTRAADQERMAEDAMSRFDNSSKN
nr:tyrosine-type recombinase/integrase [Brevundimonas diminuta]